MLTKKIKLSKLTKLELPELATNVIKILEKYDSEELKIKEVLDLLTDKQPLIDELEVEYGPHPLTPELVDLRKKRNLFAGVISTQMGVIKRTDFTGNNKKVKDTAMLVDRFLKNLRSHNEKEITQRLSQFFQKMDVDESLEAAFESFKLSGYADELRSAHSSIVNLYDERNSSLAVRPRSLVRSYEQSLRTSISHLLRQIDYSKKQYPNIDYRPLIDRLNIELISFENLINLRATALLKKKKKAEGEVEDELVIDTVGEELKVSEQPVETTPQMFQLKVESAEEDNTTDHSIEKVQLVAASSKAMQTPPVIKKE